MPRSTRKGFILVVLGTHAGDITDAKRLLLWISKLGEKKQHCMLLCVDAGTPFDEVIALRELSETMFREVRVTTNTHAVKGWPDGCYSLFTAAVKYITASWPQPFLILEPDAIPLRAGWLDAIEEEYTRCGKLFMGHIYGCEQPGLPSQLMSGIACYPANAIEYLPPEPRPVHWDVQGAPAMVANGVHTSLIKHFFGQVGLPPIFVAQKTPQSPVNAMTLEDIPKEAVIFHRDKTHSLIRLLERKLFPQEFKQPIVVCFNVHAGDVNLALRHSQWLRTLALKTPARRWAHKAVICHDPSCPVVGLNLLEQNLRHCFTEVETCVYSRPPIPAYPASANFAFQSVAFHMAKQKSPWLWMEADLVALKPDWLDQLQAEYERARAAWMGSVVHQLGHFNGTAIYPHDAANRMPRAMSCGAHQAFDMEAHHDTLSDRHDAGHLMYHTWSILNGEFCPVGGGAMPENITIDLARKIPKSAVTIHRIKSGLVELLLSGQYVH